MIDTEFAHRFKLCNAVADCPAQRQLINERVGQDIVSSLVTAS